MTQYIDMLNVKHKLEALGFKYQEGTPAEFVIIELTNALEEALGKNKPTKQKKIKKSRTEKLEAVAKAAGPACEKLGTIVTGNELNFGSLKIYANLFESLEDLKRN